jgi:TonB-linked SusC/RagA family outer membrane protein
MNKVIWLSSLVLLSFVSINTVYAQGNSVTLVAKNANAHDVFQQIEKNTVFRFSYNILPSEMQQKATFFIDGWTFGRALDYLSKLYRFTYKLGDSHVIMIIFKDDKGQTISPESLVNVSGLTKDETGKPVAGAVVQLKGTKTIDITDANGQFRLLVPKQMARLLVSSISHQPVEIEVRNRSFIEVELTRVIKQLDPVYTSSYIPSSLDRSVSNIGVKRIPENVQNISPNILNQMGSTVTGITVTPGSGQGSFVTKIESRGTSSIGLLNMPYTSNSPLILINGVPLATGAVATNIIPIAGGFYISGINNISPDDIEQIEVLKDADGTSIYGSRGANGVILITTRQGKIGAGKIQVDIQQGFGWTPGGKRLMNTREYLDMRAEAFANDRRDTTAQNAPDLKVWSDTNNTDWRKVFMGGVTRKLKAHLSISGGSPLVQYYVGGGLNREQAALPGSPSSEYRIVNGIVTFNSRDYRFTGEVMANYASGEFHGSLNDFTLGQYMSPNAPALYTAEGALAWNGYTQNPMAGIYNPYTGNSENTLGSVKLKYKVLNNLFVKFNLGANYSNFEETGALMKAAKSPGDSSNGQANHGSVYKSSWYFEPTINYAFSLGLLTVRSVVGATFQKELSKAKLIEASGYTSDAFIYWLELAPVTHASNKLNYYRYAAMFSQTKLELLNRYFVNISGRRDGSSKFGVNDQFGNFGSVGLGWIVSEESWMKNSKWLKFGKLRASYGTTGNDQISDFQTVNAWTPLTSARLYANTPGLRPSYLSNPYYHYEKNIKAEIGADLKLFPKMEFSISYFDARAKDQIVTTSTPAITGFGYSVAQNVDGMVQNTGLELQFTNSLVIKKKVDWSIAIVASFCKNRLRYFPGLDSSNYRNELSVGQSLSVHKGFLSDGVDPETGLFKVKDLNKDGQYNEDDYVNLGHTDIRNYGAITNNFRMGNFDVAMIWDWRSQKALNPLFYANPGILDEQGLANVPATLVNRWKKPGDIAEFPKVTTLTYGAAYNSWQLFKKSDKMMTDASFLRLSNLSLSYHFLLGPSKPKTPLATVYVTGENLIILSKYAGDPITQAYMGLPSLRTFTIGINVKL